MKDNTINITQEELNIAYEFLHKANRMNAINKTSKITLTAIDTPLEFIYDDTMGLKGAWVCVSDINVIDAE
jgi:hypothetical protein